jgi:hypothetical protein
MRVTASSNLFGGAERNVLLADHLAAVLGDELLHLLVHLARPDVVVADQVEGLELLLLGQELDRRLRLLRRRLAKAEHVRRALAAFVHRRIDVGRLALDRWRCSPRGWRCRASR